jgi:hypothetical protein
MVVDGQVTQVPDVKSIGYPTFSVDDRWFTYSVKGEDMRWSTVALVIQGDRWTHGEMTPEELLNFSSVPPGPPPASAPSPRDTSSTASFTSPDGKRTAAVIFKRERNPWTVVVDGESYGPYSQVEKGSFFFTSDSKHFSFAAMKGAGSLIVVDGKSYGPYPQLGKGSFFFTRDSKHFSFLARRGVDWVVVVDGHESQKYNTVSPPVFSPDGEHTAFWAHTMRFKRSWTVVSDDREIVHFEEPGALVFSPDSKHLGFVASAAFADNKWTMVVDGEPGEEFDGILQAFPIFGMDGSLEYLAHTGDSLYRVKYVLSKEPLNRPTP